MAKRAIVYIDGFNLYYGLLRSPQYRGCKWLNLEEMFRRIRQDDDVQQIKYFTGFWPDASGERHRLYIRALTMCPTVQVVLGQFKRKKLKCGVAACAHSGDRIYGSFEEKQTDVNIALHMLDDAYQKSCEVMVLVLADSDLVPAIDLVKQRSPAMKIVVYIPGPYDRYQHATELRTSAHDAKLLPAALLPRCQLPPIVSLAGGAQVTKPAQW